MREIYILNDGDSIEKAKFETNFKSIDCTVKKILGYKYIELNSGNEDITVVKNYLPLYVYKVKSGETSLDIMARGFNIDNVSSIKDNDTVILKKPRSIRYIVSPLEKIEDISQKFGLSVNSIMQNNNLQTKKLFVGQILWI